MQEQTSPEAFQQSVVNPLMQNYQQQVLPAIQQRFVDANAGSSSALNQALASSANDLVTQLGSFYLPFRQSQQQTQLSAAQGLAGLAQPQLGYAGLQNSIYQNAQGQRMGALSGLNGLAGQRTFSPMIHENQGILGPLIGAAGQAGAAGILAASSEKVKENVRDYEKGLDVINKLEERFMTNRIYRLELRIRWELLLKKFQKKFKVK